MGEFRGEFDTLRRLAEITPNTSCRSHGVSDFSPPYFHSSVSTTVHVSAT